MINHSQEDWIAAIAATDNALIIDVRTPEECETGILENAIMLDFFKSDFFQQEIAELDKSMTYFVYCRSGNRSSHTCAMIESMGIAKTVNLVGGMNAWTGPKVMPNF